MPIAISLVSTPARLSKSTGVNASISSNPSAKKTFTTDIYYYNPSVKVIKDSTNKNILDNKFTCKADGFAYCISENKLTELIIVNKIPEGKLDPTHKLYFHSNNNCFEYSNSPDVLYRTDLYKLPVYKTASLSIIEKDASGKKINSDIYLEIIDNNTDSNEFSFQEAIETKLDVERMLEEFPFKEYGVPNAFEKKLILFNMY